MCESYILDVEGDPVYCELEPDQHLPIPAIVDGVKCMAVRHVAFYHTQARYPARGDEYVNVLCMYDWRENIS